MLNYISYESTPIQPVSNDTYKERVYLSRATPSTTILHVLDNREMYFKIGLDNISHNDLVFDN